MHDMSVAQSVCGEIIPRLKKKKPSRISIEMEVGELRFHSTEQVEFWIKEIMKKEVGEGIEIKVSIEKVEPEIKCRCGFQGKVDHEHVHTTEELSHHGVFEMKCPKCGSEDYEIVKGNDVLLKNVKIAE